jgi:hypothetical protein
MFSFVTEGTSYGDTGWVLVTNDTITLDTTSLSFTQFTGTGSIVAGDGLSKSGNTLSVNVDSSTIEINADTLRVKDAGITASKLAASVAGAGLTGGAGSALAVGAGDTSITVNADSIQVALATNPGLEVSSGLKIKSDTTTANTIGLTLTSNGAGVLFDSNSFADSGSETLALASGVAGAGLSLSSGALAVNVDSSTTKITSDAIEALKGKTEAFSLSGTDITNQYIDLAHAVFGASASVNSISLSAGGVMQVKGTDYTVSLTGGSGGVTRITFAGDLATGGAAELASGDKLHVSYSYL